MTSPASGRATLQSRGALQEGALYIERAADKELREALLKGEFCYVLAPRQIGKSSLRVRTGRWLGEHGVSCAHVDLTELGRRSDGPALSGWYFGLISKLARQLRAADPLPWYEQHAALLPAQRLARYLRDVLLENHESSLVIFIDEIDFIRSLDFDTDELFALIRACYNARAEDPAYQRLTFCLLGVAAPGELIRDPEITPFNIGQGIRLRDFSRTELSAFEPALERLGGVTASWLDAIYAWTAGHPYMTQYLCEQLLDAARRAPARPLPPDEDDDNAAIGSAVTKTVTSSFLRRGRSDDPNLSYAEKRLERSRHKGDLLALYRRLVQDETVAAESGDPIQLELQLCGLGAPHQREDGCEYLRARNAIFQRVFDLAWVKNKQTQRLWSESLRRWHDSGRDAQQLLRGSELTAVQAWVRLHPREVNDEEREFLVASLEGARHEAEERHLASQAVLERERRERAEAEQRSAEAEAARLRVLNLALEQARQEAELARRDAEAAASREGAARRVAESLLRTERSLRAATMAAQPGRLLNALVEGLQAARAEMAANERPETQSWEGVVAACTQAVDGLPLIGHRSAVRSVSFSADGERVVTASTDCTAGVWHVRSCQLLFLLKGHGGPVNAAVFSPNGELILTVAVDGCAKLWDAKSGELLRTLEEGSGLLLHAAFSPDGRLAVTASSEQTLCLWDVQSGELLQRHAGVGAGATYTVSFSPTGDRILAAHEDWVVRLFSVPELEPLPLTLFNHGSAVLCASYSLDGCHIVTASSDRTARIWDARDGRALLTLQAHQDWVNCAVFSPDGRHVVTASSDRTVRIWDSWIAQTEMILQGHSASVWWVAVSPDGTRLATASADGTARIWPLQEGRICVPLRGHQDSVYAAAFSPDGQRIVSAGRDRRAIIWDAVTGRALRTLEGHEENILCAAFSSDGRRVLTGARDGVVCSWDVQSGQELHRLPRHSASIFDVACSGDNRFIATACADQLAHIWEVGAKLPLHALRGHRDRVTSARFSHDNQLLVTASNDRTVRVWDVQSGEQRALIGTHPDRVRQAVFSPDGRRVLTTCEDRIARLWDSKGGGLLLELHGHAGRVTGVDFSPDGSLIATASVDGSVRIWDSGDGRPLLTFTGHRDIVYSVGFSPDGTRIVSAGDSGTVFISPAHNADYYAFGCRILRSFAPLSEASADELADILAASPRALDGQGATLDLGVGSR